jgi:8-oxo-dGTP diphosphatase
MVVAAAALVAGDGRILLQQRAPDRDMAGLWEFPGGKVEDGETPEHALARELEEELGVTIDVGALAPAAFASHPNRGRHMILLLYLCRHWAGEPQALDASALAWVHASDMRSLPMPPADKPLVEQLEAMLQT